MFTIESAAVAITDYLAKSLKENGSIKTFFSEFTDATVAWIKPIFLKADDSEKKVIKDLITNSDDKAIHEKVKTLIEAKAEEDDNALAILTEMAEIAMKKMGDTVVNTNNINVTGDNNTVIQDVFDSEITIGNDNSVNDSHHIKHSGTGDILNTIVNIPQKTLTDLDDYEDYLKRAIANQTAATSHVIVGKTADDLDPEQLAKFWQLDRVQQQLTAYNVPPDAPLNLKLRALRLMTNGYVVKGTFLCLTHLSTSSTDIFFRLA